MRPISQFIVGFASAVLLTSAVRGVEPSVTTAGLPLTFDIAAFVECLDGPAAAVSPGCSTSNFHPDARSSFAAFPVFGRSGTDRVPRLRSVYRSSGGQHLHVA
mgnify:CR=1 FL=1